MAHTNDRPLCVITGATAGIGKATAAGLADRGFDLVVVARNPQKAAAVQAELEQRTGPGRVTTLQADLVSQPEIRRVAAELASRHPHIDVLINNAGVFYTERQMTGDGVEATFAINHLGPFLLTQLLLPQLMASARGGRVVTVASFVHRFAFLDFDDLDSSRKFNGVRAYGRSKVANILFTREQARRLEGTRVTANCLDPGAVRTDMNPSKGLLGLGNRLISFIYKSPEQGAETSIYLATSPEVAGVSGRYFSSCKEAWPSWHAARDADAARLWERSLRLTGLPG